MSVAAEGGPVSAAHRAVALADDINPQMNRATCSCGWSAKQADYGLADAWKRADAHRRAASRVTYAPAADGTVSALASDALNAVLDALTTDQRRDASSILLGYLWSAADDETRDAALAAMRRHV